jgi:hypothetical protein
LSRRLDLCVVVRQCSVQVSFIQLDDGQIQQAYWLAEARPPTETELALLVPYAQKHGLENFCRLLLNSNEFMFVD